jgi:tRNA-Thr(GGU) m(6)t(6)A37 methyltransferase TsaA
MKQTALKEDGMIDIIYRPIGRIRSPFRTTEGTPIQPPGARGAEGRIEVFREYTEGLTDLAGFSHIYLLYHCHLAGPYRLKVTPFLDDQTRGLFATRAPARPNPIGLSVVRLIGVTNHILKIKDVDVIDGTPLLDIKPYVPDFDVRTVDSCGWIEKSSRRLDAVRDDGRFGDR